jgi:lysophospholipase L1-like esterase
MGAAKVFSRSVGFGTVGFDPTMVGVWQHVTVNVENELAGKEWDGLYFGINPDTHIDFDQITVSSGSSTAQGPPQLDPKTLQDVTNEGASTDKEITARSFKVTDAPLGFLVGADGTIVDPADFGGADIDFADDLESDDNTKVLSGRAGTVIKNFLAGKASQEALDAVNSILGRKLESAEAQLLFQAYTKIFTQGEKDKLAEIDLSQLATVQSVNDILTILASDDTTLDELQEVVSYIKANRSDLANLSIPNIAGLADALSGKALQSFVLAEIAKLFPKTGGTIEGGITLKDQFNIDAAIPRIQLYVAGVRKWLAYNLPSDDSWMFKATNVIMRLFQNGNISFDMDASGNNPTMSLVDGKLYANASEVTFDVLGGKMSEIFGFDGNQVLLDNATRKPISDFVMKTGSVYSTITIDDIEYEDIQIETLSPTGDVTISVLNDRINPVMIVNGSTGIRFNLKISGTYLMIAGDKTSFLAITLDNTANSGALFRFTDNDVQVKIIDLPNVIIPFSAKIETYRVEKIIYIKVNNELRFTFDYTNRAEPEFNNPQFGIAVRAERITTYPLFAGNVEKIVELGVIDDFRERIKRLEVNYPNSAVSIFNGKKYSSLGDSVDANGQTQNKLVTDFQIAEHTNIAVSGATMSSGANSIIDQIPNIVGSIPNREPALITVGGGTNDFGKNVPLGDIDSTDTTTFYGGVRHIAETLKDIHRFNEIYFLSPTIRAYSGTGSQPSGMVNDIGLSLYDYVDAIEKVGALYGIYVVNLVDLWPVNMTNLSDFSGDGLHPNGAGHILRAQGIIDFMKKTYLG